MLMQPDNQNNFRDENINDSDNSLDARSSFYPLDDVNEKTSIGQDKFEIPQGMYQPAESIDQNDSPDNNPDADPDSVDDGLVYWSADEYVNIEKNGVWYALFALVVIGLIALDLFVIKAYTFSILVSVMAIYVVILARRPPRLINYSISDQGLYVGEKLYQFSEFKTFGLITDRGQQSIVLIPVKRFSLGVTVYFPYEMGEKIVDVLGSRLPMQELKHDIIDKIVQKLRL